MSAAPPPATPSIPGGLAALPAASAAKLGLDRSTVGKWRRRFAERRVDGLHDKPRSGAPRTVDDARIEAVIVRTLESCPENATH
ncbi:helix-turn-helix domain-containing protein, partial [Bradyrhizobium sp. th.b2]|uniref:helix-turn-helix domain-containing protein n=1 Tax=Bradyrhizobium sp. th-b2 TaxID=172088 RepID=UPI003528B2ED